MVGALPSRVSLGGARRAEPAGPRRRWVGAETEVEDRAPREASAAPTAKVPSASGGALARHRGKRPPTPRWVMTGSINSKRPKRALPTVVIGKQLGGVDARDRGDLAHLGSGPASDLVPRCRTSWGTNIVSVSCRAPLRLTLAVAKAADRKPDFLLPGY